MVTNATKTSRWTNPSRPRVRTSVTIPLLFLLGAARCGSGTPSPADQTITRIHRAFAGVARFRDSVGYLPDRLTDVCKMDAWWCEGDSTRWARDGWGRALSYVVSNTGYQIRSAGEDAMPNTPDDIAFSSAQERRLMQALGGCYQFSHTPPGLSNGKFVLDTSRRGAAEYALLPLMGYREAAWYPVPSAGVWLEWRTTPSGVLVQFSPSGDSLLGTVTEGSDFGSARRVLVAAHRINCA